METFVVAHNCDKAGIQSLVAPEHLCKNWNGKDSPFPPCALFKEADWHTCPFLVEAKKRPVIEIDTGFVPRPAVIKVITEESRPEVKTVTKSKSKKKKMSMTGMEKLL